MLLGSGGKVHQQYKIDGIPKTFLYDRDGKLVANLGYAHADQSVAMLQKAGFTP